MKHQSYYLNNQNYSEYLNHQNRSIFKKYVDYIVKFTKIDSSVLEVGCGTGIVLSMCNKKNRKQSIGIDVSLPSIAHCKSRDNNCVWYDGGVIPFKSQSFDIVSSYNVLEHTDNPNFFLDESLRVLKIGGYIFICCPNFLSITNNFHHHTRGVKQKMFNILDLIILFITKKRFFTKMKAVNRNIFQPDDDAVNVTNPLTIILWARHNKLSLKYWSSQIVYNMGIVNYLDRSIFRLFLGSSFFIFKKNV